jgi:carotenoid cleavage dioxygenase-like enzyme
MVNATHLSGIVKYDLTKEPELGKEKLKVGGNVAGVYWHGDQCWGSEPVFVPNKLGREGEEDDGYLLNFVIEENTL